MRKTVTLLILSLISVVFVGCDSLSTVTDITTFGSNTSTVNTTTEYLGEEDSMVSEVVYPHDEVVEVNIDITSENYNDIVDNAMDEEYHTCDITYNGYTLENVAIRTKGNSSLKDVYQSDGDRFSFNVDLNYYEDQDLFGIDKLILNNLYRDPTMMAEYVTYEALASLGTVSSRTTFIALSINGEYYGLYLSVEHVSNEFLDINYDYDEGELYKPENGAGANLDYITDTYNYYGLVDENNEETDNTAIIEFMERLETGEDIDEVFNVEGYLKYLAVSIYTINLDSYQSGMTHNYYLYNNEGVFEWIGWDYNMAFNGFPMIDISDSEAIKYLIDEPVVNSMSNYPLIDAILSNESYLETYHTYMQALVDNYFNYENFETRVNEIAAMIDIYVETDPSSFYTYTEYQDALDNSSWNSYSILEFVLERTQNVQDQLDGIIPSTNDGNGNVISQQGPPR